MEQIPLTAIRRESTGKGPAKQMRAKGQVPAVFYAGGQEAAKLTIEQAEIERLLRGTSGGNAFLSLTIAGEAPRMAVIKDLQFDYLGKSILHADFYEVRADQELTLEVSIELVGEPKGMTTGALISQSAYTASVTGLVADIPDSISLDISEMEMGDALHAENLPLPEGVKLSGDDNYMVVSLSEAILATEDEEAEGEEDEEGEEGDEEKTEERGE
ncbi:MAG: 50S ribosomal protein L25 [Desulfarculus sp.]|nr:50S ribosomal protein L25 [Pseudomonadota bacterium]MBV1718183.1 50S ribosomal protein L25 [Desulfarculus sp.]MBU4575696.1 50S ribosomal protein L25 [Pseudomonadota bacterium]MBU4598677.1 50S ribosomal protein L25 [Pseudomonadota bacterium]MBV1738791.1 50S ribosomal protein L25 [Desulfarculus sp.]